MKHSDSKLYIFVLFLCIIGACSTPKKTSPWLLGFEKTEINPVLVADSSALFYDSLSGQIVNWQRADVFNPAAIVYQDTLFVLFRAEDNPGAILGRRTSRIGLAASTDGVNFTKYPEPILFPTNDEFASIDQPGGVEDPRVVRMEDGGFLMLYTSWDYDVARLSAATSQDLKIWTKQGAVFNKAYDGRFKNHWSKSGAVVSKIIDGSPVAQQINGRYWMYWGEDFVNVAISENLKEWEPLLDENGGLLRVMETREGFFDSRLTEPGPPAIMTDQGILLLYNGKNDEGDKADPNLPKGTYCGGQALFDLNDPTRLIDRMDQPFICPDLPHEMSGQYAFGTTFIEGLVLYKGRWFLYYGTADSMVGLAVTDQTMGY